MTIHWKTVERYFIVVLFVFQFYPVCNFENNVSILDLALSTVKGLRFVQVSHNFFNLLRPSIKLQFLLLGFHTFPTEVVGRSC